MNENSPPSLYRCRSVQRLADAVPGGLLDRGRSQDRARRGAGPPAAVEQDGPCEHHRRGAADRPTSPCRVGATSSDVPSAARSAAGIAASLPAAQRCSAASARLWACRPRRCRSTDPARSRPSEAASASRRVCRATRCQAGEKLVTEQSQVDTGKGAGPLLPGRGGVPQGGGDVVVPHRRPDRQPR